MDEYRVRTSRQSYDWKLVLMYLLLTFIGWINIYASVHGADVNGIMDYTANCGKQAIWMMTAFGLAGVIIFVISPNLWDSGAVLLYAVAVCLLIAVIFFGVEVKGSRSWFSFGPVRFQPAEISKITTSLLLAFVMSRPGFRITRMKDLLKAAAVIAMPMLIILAESETGSSLVYIGFIFVLYREGLSGWILALVGMAILIFILTLIASPFTAILVLAGILSICCALSYKKMWRWIGIFSIVIAFFAAVPQLWTLLIKALVPEAIGPDGILPANAVPDTGNFWRFLPAIRPVHILLATAAICIPFILWHAYRRKDIFTRLAVLSFVTGTALVFSAEFIFNNVLQDHQRKRIEVLLGMKEDPSGVGYNVRQSMIAIGSGGLTGKGYLHGTQTTYGFVPEQSTDFIFCTVGEEWGFVGCSAVILLYVLLISQIIKDSEHSRESFTRIYGYCLASCLFMHLFINIGMTIGLMPVIGIPLPFMSYGGSSLWAFSAMLAIFIALDHRERRYF